MSPGEVAEWSNAFDLKSNEPKGSVGSNPTLSVQNECASAHRQGAFVLLKSSLNQDLPS
jgi:hypothetical protein